MCLPSGDHEMPIGGKSRLVNATVSPLSIQRLWICGVPLRSDVKSRMLPSGDHRGDESLYRPLVSGLLSVPSKSMIHRFE
jgi:hypothetical protein